MSKLISIKEYAELNGINETTVRNRIQRGCLEAEHTTEGIKIRPDAMYNSKITKKNKRKCIICGKIFETPPSNNKLTCGKECQKKYAAIRKTGTKLSDETKKKISEKSQGRDMKELIKSSIIAIHNSPIAGPYESNVNAKDWHLISPEGKHFYFHSLNFWLRNEGSKYFDVSTTRTYNNARSGLEGAKRAMLGRNYPCCTYKGWKVIPEENN